MILMRNVFQAKYGRGDDLVELMQGVQGLLTKHGGATQRILTDLAGPFFTVITETEFESLADFESAFGKMFADPEFGQWFSRMPELVESGSREFFTIVD